MWCADVETAWATTAVWQKQCSKLLQSFLAWYGRSTDHWWFTANGEAVKVFDISRQDARFESPWYMFSGGGVLSFSGQAYKLSFMQPQNTKFPYQRLGIIRESDFADFSDGRKFGKRFRSYMNNPDSIW